MWLNFAPRANQGSPIPESATATRFDYETLYLTWTEVAIDIRSQESTLNIPTSTRNEPSQVRSSLSGA